MPIETINNMRERIQSIKAYIKAYHYSNFEEVYAQFDRDTNYLLDPSFLVKEEEPSSAVLDPSLNANVNNNNSSGVDPRLDESYESKCYL